MEILDHEYWFKWAKSITDESITRLEEGANNLKKLVFRLWGIYTSFYTGGVFAVSFESIDIPTIVIVMLGIPVITLLIAYCLCFWAKLPVGTIFRTEIPESIEGGFFEIVQKKSNRLNVAIVSMFISAGCLSMGLFSWFISKNLQSEKQRNKTEFLSCLNYSQDSVFVSGIFPADTHVSIKIEVLDSAKKKTPIYVNYEKINSDGIFNRKFALDSIKTEFVFVTV